MKKMKAGMIILLAALLSMVLLPACTPADDNPGGSLKASGTISATEINISPELSGKVVEVAIKEGDKVAAGDVLFRLDDELLKAQQHQAQTAVDTATAAVESAQLQLQSAQIQADLTKQSARQQLALASQADKKTEQPDEFKQPEWYFYKGEKITSALSAVDAAQKTLDARKADLDQELSNASNQDFVAAEKRLGAAQMVFLAAQETLDKAEKVTDNKEYLVTEAQKALDSAKAELEASQLDYDRILTTTAAENVLEARARVATAQMLLDNSRATYDQLMIGEESLAVEAANKAVEMAESAVKQAETGLAQAQAALDLLNLQLEKTTVTAPISGTVLAMNVDEGEMVGAGSLVMVLGQLDEVTLTVYVPEDQYGRISLGQPASVMVDSFASRTFTGTVRHIADQAEFTPRNVQTTAGRKTTVYAVKISLANTDGSLKPGMSADVTID